MFATQIDYWNDVMKKVQDNYEMSLNSGKSFQKAYSDFLKDLMETGYGSYGEFQKSAEEVGRKMMTASVEQMNKFSKLYMEQLDQSFDQMRETMDKFNVRQDDYRKEMESIWNKNTKALKKQMDEMTEMVRKAQMDNTEEIFKIYKTFTQKGLDEINRRMEMLEKTTA